MAGYAEIIGRTETSDALLPDQTINEIIQTAPENSVLLSRARTVRLSAKRAKQPVLNSLPDAYWVNGDTGLKQTTDTSWSGTTITAEELAVIVPIPNTVVDDANVPLWDAVRPLLAEAIGKKVDQAGIFGTDKPASWPTAIIPAAIAAGNTVTAGTGADFGVDVATLGSAEGLVVI
jgi:HK97 family phage major capsid protein